jgi:hypothetical protein
MLIYHVEHYGFNMPFLPFVKETFQEIAHQFKGEVSAKNRPEGGAEFEIVLPIAGKDSSENFFL